MTELTAIADLVTETGPSKAVTPIVLSELQESAANAVTSWFTSDTGKQPFFYLAGYAGSGKTSIAKELVRRLGADRKSWSYCYAAFTGKAALVLESKGCFPSSTVHGLIYKPVMENKELTFVRRDVSELRNRHLVILDECSMVNNEMALDLLSFKIPILVLGDPGQLPPIGGAGYFTARAPDFMLTEIHRQAEGSPIIGAATAARQSRPIPIGAQITDFGTLIAYTKRLSNDDLMAADQVLCGTNKTRTALNRNYRSVLKHTSPLPQPGEKLICLQNNWDLPGMANGSLWRVISCADASTREFPDRLRLKLSVWEAEAGDGYVEAITHKCFFDPAVKPPEGRAWRGLTQFTYGYVITVHKSQGSQWDHVVLLDESEAFRDNRKEWLYTAITRASKVLEIY